MRQRYAAKADKTTQGIVDHLRLSGFVVCHIGRPVDLSVTHPSWPKNIWRKIECKSPMGKRGQVWRDARQKKQQEFCALHEIPYVTDGPTALAYLQGYTP